MAAWRHGMAACHQHNVKEMSSARRKQHQRSIVSVGIGGGNISEKMAAKMAKINREREEMALNNEMAA